MVVQNFSASLNHGSQYIYQSMPRMLTLWLDFGSEVMTCDRGDTALQGMRMGLQKLNKVCQLHENNLEVVTCIT